MSQPGFYAYRAVMMGSPILLKLPQPDEPLARNVFRLIKQQENLLTVNRPLPDTAADRTALSQVMAVNLAAGQHPVQVSQPVFNLIARAHQVSVLPGSAFNFAIGPLVKRWKIGFQGNSVPPQADVTALLKLTDARQVVLDPAARSVFLPQAGMEIDLGAIAKGYIADVVRDYLRQQGVVDALINLGGNVQTLGNSAGQPWGIGLRRPYGGEGEPIGVVSVSGKSVVTSGVYERYFELNGRRYHHILDPQNGYPLDNELLSVTVISDQSIDGDIWTTLLYGMGVEQGLRCLKDQPEIEAIFVTRDRQVICSSQRQFSFTLLDAECFSVSL
ncbi:FAD:protein FMN transferase [Erwinia sp. E602]|uniref:FAD:protein FMN transferase n=1 Tax=Erwinia sp. E602 TaxID=2675378 RepID=UPI001BAB5BC8|nr:FAD:protein FMN transferase [Erwinia sp. E602]QUG75335.1 FAD:protein FMN transferase [Erwinia sp. E602]